MTGDHLGHGTDRFLELEGALVSVTMNLDSYEDGEAEANAVTPERSSIALDVSFTFQSLDAPETGGRRQSHLVGKSYVAHPCVGLEFGDNPTVDGIQIKIWHK